MSLPSSYYTFQKTLDQFIYFSPITMGGSSGRSVKISKALFLPFFCAVDPNTHDGQAIIRQIENLRTTCTIARGETGSNYANNPKQSSQHIACLGKLNDGFSQVLIVKNLHVHYRISQESGDKCPTIYITQVKAINRDAGSLPGLYELKTSLRGSVLPEQMKNKQVDGKKVYINGASQTVKDAMMQAQYATSDKNTILFYSPASVSDDFGMWQSKALSHATKNTINELVNVFKENQNRGVSWYVEGEGTALLSEALKRIPGELNKHQFRFVNPIGNTSKVLQILTTKKAILEGDFFSYHHNATALFSISKQKDKLMSAMGKLPAGKNYDKITRSYIMKSIEGLAHVGSRSVTQHDKLNLANQTFVQWLRKAGVYR